ncbi:hypothetical protein [Nocardia pseudovaccinii]|uniref:hypothetical protein n=1 Tax=Nocardia pseudovaccinii TaxID=189540 RepID=UPI0012F51E69|nr:hypothetical protein [Nocardia pseudovaccinii]
MIALDAQIAIAHSDKERAPRRTSRPSVTTRSVVERPWIYRRRRARGGDAVAGNAGSNIVADRKWVLGGALVLLPWRPG